MVAAYKVVVWGLATYLAVAAAPATVVQTPAPSPPQDKATDILVVGRRSGIPMWRVNSGQTTLVLVGTIDGLARNTEWNPEPLVQALRMSDRVMFPQSQQVTASPFAMIGYLAKWRSQASLPKGQSLQNLLTPAQLERLRLLQRRGVAKQGAERTHPLHLAFALRDRVKDGAGGFGQNANQYVLAAIKKHRLELVPIARSSARPFAAELFGGSPARHVPCLLDAMTLAEAGPAAIIARSQAWAQRRVPQVLSSPAERVFQSCFPASPAEAPERRAALQVILERLLLEPKVTVVVLDLDTLAGRDGLLDGLAGSGHRVVGPTWK